MVELCIDQFSSFSEAMNKKARTMFETGFNETLITWFIHPGVVVRNGHSNKPAAVRSVLFCS